MILPWGTDAPIYHWPIATVSLIAANILMFLGQASGAVDAEAYALALGDGVHPLQWITHNFLHANVIHLLGNMLFLWTFGLIVEGKLGWWRMLAVCLAIGTLHGAGVQLLLLREDPPTLALGASAIVFGLVALCLVWAPANEITLHGFSWMGYWSWEAPIWLLALFYVGQEGIWFVLGAMGGLSGARIGSAIGHLSGALWGWAVGTVMINRHWVDCEGWDVYSMMRKRASLGAQWKSRGKQMERAAKRDRSRPRVVVANAETSPSIAPALGAQIDEMLDAGHFEGAVNVIDRRARTDDSWPLRSELLGWIGRMQKAGAAEASIPLMRLYCSRFPDQADRVRLKLAQTLVGMGRGQSASRVLAELAWESLAPNLQNVYTQISREIQRLSEEGAYEIEETA